MISCWDHAGIRQGRVMSQITPDVRSALHPEYDLIHHSARQKSEKSGKDKGKNIQGNHHLLMTSDIPNPHEIKGKSD